MAHRAYSKRYFMICDHQCMTNWNSHVHRRRQYSPCRNCICDWQERRTPGSCDSRIWTRLRRTLNTMTYN